MLSIQWTVGLDFQFRTVRLLQCLSMIHYEVDKHCTFFRKIPQKTNSKISEYAPRACSAKLQPKTPSAVPSFGQVLLNMLVVSEKEDAGVRGMILVGVSSAKDWLRKFNLLTIGFFQLKMDQIALSLGPWKC